MSLFPGVNFPPGGEKALSLPQRKQFRNQACFSMWMTGSDSPFTSGIEMGFTAT